MNTDKIYAEALANEYAPKDTSKVVALKKLDQRVKLPAEILAYTLGIAAALLMGAGMCISMGVIGAGTAGSMAVGVIIGVIGLFGMGIMQLAKEISENLGVSETSFSQSARPTLR